MWIFSPSGLLMPGLVPLDKEGNSVANPVLTRNGEFELQVRGRVRSHLEYFIEENFIPLGLEYSEVEATPNMDYNYRFYTTRANLAQAVANQVLNIDYVKYKEQSERKGADNKPMYPDGKKFHSVLVRAWGLLQDLNPAGGWYGTYSSSNPRGSKSRSPYSGSNKPVTSSNSILAEHYGDTWSADSADILDPYEMDDWVPTDLQEANAIMDSMEGVPLDQWDSFLTEREKRIIEKVYPSAVVPEVTPSRKETRRARKSKKGRGVHLQKN